MNRDYSVKEVLQKKGKSTTFFAIAGFASIIILNNKQAWRIQEFRQHWTGCCFWNNNLPDC